MDDMILLSLLHYIGDGFRLSVEDRQYRLFSDRVKAEDWLKQNGFSYHPRTFLKGDPLDWCYEKEAAWDFIDVCINEYEVDDETPLHFEPIEAPWCTALRIEGFIESLQEQGFSPEQIKEIYKRHFGEECHYELD